MKYLLNRGADRHQKSFEGLYVKITLPEVHR